MSRHLTRFSQQAFTVVELLVVILVVAILATVTVVAFSGIQQRAVNAQVEAAMNASEKALRLYNVSEGKPLQSKVPWYHVSVINMAGVCIAGGWPTSTELAEEMGSTELLRNTANALGPNSDEFRALFCGDGGGNSSATRSDALAQINDAIITSEVRAAFPKAPSFNGISLDAVNNSGAIEKFTIRGIRYSYNGSSINPASYLFYPIYGKQCFAGDMSIRLQDTIWVSAGGGEWNGTFTTGGDYTTNNSQYCVRTVKY